jgi:hypothetical protein
MDGKFERDKVGENQNNRTRNKKRQVEGDLGKKVSKGRNGSDGHLDIKWNDLPLFISDQMNEGCRGYAPAGKKLKMGRC